MDAPFVNIHTHRRTGTGIEMVSVDLGLRRPEAAGEQHSPSVRHPLSEPKELSAPPAPPFSIGVHPWHLDRTDLSAALHRMETAPAAAIGEIGLDFAPDVTSDHGLQKTVFAAQLRIACERNLPVVLHCVRAFEPAMEVLSAYRLPAVIFHGFTGSREQAARAIRSGYFLSPGERSLNSSKTLEAIKSIPLENMFLETDDSPITIAEVYSRAALILDTTVADLARQIYDNYTRIFGKLPL